MVTIDSRTPTQRAKAVWSTARQMLLNMGQVRPRASVSVEKQRRQEQESNRFWRPIANADSHG